MIRLNISIEYETSPEASAFQWLTADQTAGKRQPYLFSQCQVCTIGFSQIQMHNIFYKFLTDTVNLNLFDT